MKAVIIQERGKSNVADIPKHSMRPDYSRIKTVAVAVNPSCDVSGVVEEVGVDVKTDIRLGDSVFGVCHCANWNNAEDGAFAEFAMVKDGHFARLPEGLRFEAAATLGVGVTTVGQALYMTLKLPLPTESSKEKTPILIYGGSTATGTLAIQYAKLSGLTVITTASAKNFDLVKSRGADEIFDYHDPDCAQKIRECTNNSLRYVLDTISTEQSYKICAAALPTDSAEELNLVALLPLDGWPREDVNVKVIIGYTTFGEAFSKFGVDFPPMKEHFDFGKMFWQLNANLLTDGKIQRHPVTMRSGGLYGIPAGIAEVATGAVSGLKLVYRVDETHAAEDLGYSGDNVVLQGPSLTKW
ncbi:MAG: hypothetical protein M1822_005666 [Bathelium mastoideum]|nr:MAG: hypothetical protein M1822_005666 [Bathelium mastoideum]